MSMDKIFLAAFQGLWVIGRHNRISGHDYLFEPCIYVFDKTQHGIMSMPGKPDKLCIDSAYFNYEVTDKEVIELYKRKTSVIDVPDASVIVR